MQFHTQGQEEAKHIIRTEKALLLIPIYVNCNRMSLFHYIMTRETQKYQIGQTQQHT